MRYADTAQGFTNDSFRVYVPFSKSVFRAGEVGDRFSTPCRVLEFNCEQEVVSHAIPVVVGLSQNRVEAVFRLRALS